MHDTYAYTYAYACTYVFTGLCMGMRLPVYRLTLSKTLQLLCAFEHVISCWAGIRVVSAR